VSEWAEQGDWGGATPQFTVVARESIQALTVDLTSRRLPPVVVAVVHASRHLAAATGEQGRTQRPGIKWFIPTKLDLTTDAEYVANLVNVNVWLELYGYAVPA